MQALPKDWLSLTPEPESELPRALATLRAGGEPSNEQIRAESERIERLVVGARIGAYARWLREARELAGAESADPVLRSAAALTNEILDNHDALALGLTKRSRDDTAGGGTE
jgi:hypothetical protein